MALVALGFGLGFAVAMQPGPMSLWLLRSTLAGGVAVGVAIGLGIALVDMFYAGLGASGATVLLGIDDDVRTIGGLVGATALVVLGLLVLSNARRIDAHAAGRERVTSPKGAFSISIMATLANPATIASWAAIFAAAGVAASVDELHEGARLVAGVGLGSVAWFAIVSVVAALVGTRIGNRTLQVVDVIAGLGLVAFGFALGAQVA